MLWLAAGIALLALSLAWVAGWATEGGHDALGSWLVAAWVGALFLLIAGILTYEAGEDAGDAEAVERIACETAGGTWYRDGAAVDDDVVYCLESLRPLTVAP